MAAKADLAQGFVGVVACGPAGAAEHDVLPDTLGRDEPRLLEDDGSHCRHDQRSGVSGIEPGEQPQQRGLAGAGRAEHRNEFAGLDIEIDTVEDGTFSEDFAQAAQLDGARETGRG